MLICRIKIEDLFDRVASFPKPAWYSLSCRCGSSALVRRPLEWILYLWRRVRRYCNRSYLFCLSTFLWLRWIRLWPSNLEVSRFPNKLTSVRRVFIEFGDCQFLAGALFFRNWAISCLLLWKHNFFVRIGLVYFQNNLRLLIQYIKISVFIFCASDGTFISCIYWLKRKLIVYNFFLYLNKTRMLSTILTNKSFIRNTYNS